MTLSGIRLKPLWLQQSVYKVGEQEQSRDPANDVVHDELLWEMFSAIRDGRRLW